MQWQVQLAGGKEQSPQIEQFTANKSNKVGTGEQNGGKAGSEAAAQAGKLTSSLPYLRDFVSLAVYIDF